MPTLIPDYRSCIDHLPEGTTLVVHRTSWDDYECLVEELAGQPKRHVSYECGRLEIMTPLAEHERDIRFIDDLVRVVAEGLDVQVEKLGSTTWKSRRLARGAEPDACYYVASAERIIGRKNIRIDTDPPPDIVVEIDVTNESVRKFSIYAAFGVGEIWHIEDGDTVHFLQLAGGEYRAIPESASFPGLIPSMLAHALAASRTAGQTAALKAFRQQWHSRSQNP